MTSLLTSVSSILAPLVDDSPAPEDVTPGWIYAVVFISLIVVTILLWLSMRKQLGKIRFGDETNGVSPGDEPVDPKP